MPAEGDAPLDAHSLRAAEFAALGSRLFLNAAGYGPLPRRARGAAEAYAARRAAGDLAPGDMGDILAPVRAAAARLIGAHADEIALVPNATAGLNLAATVLRQRRRQGDGRRGIVLSDGEFPANVYPWLALEREGFHVRRVPADALGRPREDALLEAIAAPDACAFAISAVQFASGWRADLQRLGELCHARDVLCIVDAIQATGIVPIDVRAAHVDVLATGGEKWLLAPFGTGFAFVRAGLSRLYEPDLPGWLAFGATQSVDRLCTYEYDLLEDARRWELGLLPIGELLALQQSLELLLELGIARIFAHVQRLHEPLLAWLRASAATLVSEPGHHSSGMVCFRTRDTGASFHALTNAGIRCALREGSIRIAPHCYNTGEELEEVVRVLEAGG